MNYADWTLHCPAELLGGQPGITQGSSWDDTRIIARIVKAYQLSTKTKYSEGVSQWNQEIHALKHDAHKIFSAGSFAEAANILRDPSSNFLFSGFDNLCKHHNDKLQAEWWRGWLKNVAVDRLLALAQSIGTIRLENPEIYGSGLPAPVDIDLVLNGLDQFFGYRVDFPNPFKNEIGLQTSRGVASDRAVYALYQAAWLKLNGSPQRILEIGAGLGRSAYYAALVGFEKYVIVDLPLTAAAQAYFLAFTFGENALSLYGEPSNERKIQISPPTTINEVGTFDVALNIDSLTEMPIESARKYLRQISLSCKRFFSLNHEVNSFTVGELLKETPTKSITRSPSWIRRGYVEETAEY